MGSGTSKEAMSAAEKFVQEKIGSKAVVVFSKTYCPFCTKAKNVLEKYKLGDEKYEVIEIEDREDCAPIQDYLNKLTGARSVPRVFIGGKCIGGGDETAQMEKAGKLQPLIQSAIAG